MIIDLGVHISGPSMLDIQLFGVILYKYTIEKRDTASKSQMKITKGSTN